mgnify:CR=1 FL=1|jgi:serine protease SohB
MLKFLKRLLPKKLRGDAVTIPVVPLSGTIMAGGSQLRPAINMQSVGPLLEKAFGVKAAPAVAILINSPGGSPVQSRAIFNRIRGLAREKDKKVLVFVEDVAASGGYLIALAGDEIIADATSIVGSIGVISGGFGFPELMKKLGVERRVYTAGSNKSVLDPFLPEKTSDIDHLKSLQVEVHKIFIDMVKERRAGRLVESDEIFSGLFWSGERGLALGLVDGLGDLHQELRKRYGDKVNIDLVSRPRGLLSRFMPGAKYRASLGGSLGAEAVAGLVEVAEERALWARYGL